MVAIAHQVVWCTDDVAFEGAEFLGGRIVAIRILALRVLGDSRWVKDSKAFLPGPLVLAGLFLWFSDWFVASACPATAHLRREWRQARVFLSFLSGIPASARVPPPRNESDHQLKQCRRLHLALSTMLSPLAPGGGTRCHPPVGTERWRERQCAPFSVAWCTGTALIWINVQWNLLLAAWGQVGLGSSRQVERATHDLRNITGFRIADEL